MCGMNCSQSSGASLVGVTDWNTSECDADKVEVGEERTAKHTGKPFAACTPETHWKHAFYIHILQFPSLLYHTAYIPFDDDGQWVGVGLGVGGVRVLIAHPVAFRFSTFHHWVSISEWKTVFFVLLFKCLFSQTWGTTLLSISMTLSACASSSQSPFYTLK